MPTRYFDELCMRLPQLQTLRCDFLALYELLCATFTRDGTLFVCGNGGSRSDADHIAGELMKGFLLPRSLPSPAREGLMAICPEDGALLAGQLQGGLRAVVLGSSDALHTAVGNDVAGDLGLAQHLYAMARPGDTLLALSTSGNARNVLLACHVARSLGLPVAALTGTPGGRLARTADICIRAPASATHLVQELHLPLYHCLCAMVEHHFFGEEVE